MARAKGLVSAVASAAIILTGAGVAYVGYGWLTDNEPRTVAGDEDSTPTADASSRPSDRITLCVQYVEADASGSPEAAQVESNAKAAIERLLPELETDPLWEAAGFRLGTTLDIGCPSEPLPLSGGINAEARITDFTKIPSVGRSSYFHDFIYILPNLEDINALLRQTDIRVWPQEYICDGPAGAPPCWEVTQAIYVTADEILNGSVSMESLLRQASGFASRDAGY